MRTPTRHVPNADAGTLVASRVISTKPCKLFSVLVLNTSGSTQYIQIHETTSLPNNGQKPVLPSMPVAAGQFAAIDLGVPAGVDLAACTICNSSTADVKTIGAADCQISAIIAG